MRIDHLSPAELKDLRAPLVDLYKRCFAEPPWNETDFQFYEDALVDHLAEPGLVVVAAQQDGDLVGIVYGWPAPAVRPDTPFHRTVPESAHPYMITPAMVVAELMVHPGHQRKGIGRALMSQYMAGRDSGWLVTHPDAPARALYDAMGWQSGETFINHRGVPRVFYFRRREVSRANELAG